MIDVIYRIINLLKRFSKFIIQIYCGSFRCWRL